MSETILRIINLHKSINGKNLFKDANFRIKNDDCVGIIGPNGSGKTTFLRIILGIVKPDYGEILFKNDMKIRYLEQFSSGIFNCSVDDFLKKSNNINGEKYKIKELTDQLANPDIYNSEEYKTIIDKIQELKKSSINNNILTFDKISKTLDELDLKNINPDTKLANLSGGERQKLFIASIFSNLKSNNLLLLDEPTNNLDIETIEWVEQKIADFNGPALTCTHDRYLLDDLVDKIIDINDGKIVFYDNTYEEFEERQILRRRMDYQEYKKHLSNLKRQKVIIGKLSRRNRYNKQISSKIKRFKKIKKLDNPMLKDYIMKLNFENVFKSGKNISDGVNICKKYGDNILLNNADFEIFSGQKIGLIGPNGCGKTTFLKIIVGLEDIEKGKISISRGVKYGYLDQENLSLNQDKNLVNEVLSEKTDLKERDAKALLGQFNFKNDEIYKQVFALSGGERARLSILKLIIKPYNFLVLDEPNNHMDMQSREAVEQAINSYNGTVIVASHDRKFLDNVVDTIFLMEKYKIKMYVGNYSQSRLKRQNELLGTTEEDDIGMFGENINRYVVTKSFKNWATSKYFRVGEKVLIGDHNMEKFDWAIKGGRLKIIRKR